mmetsp:Transcript_27016/g.62251  ORF Transcript_27016/g.62251 Transcript_27016/m.62251 type:complete len:225 (+) Transcript_27016:20-694(+)
MRIETRCSHWWTGCRRACSEAVVAAVLPMCLPVPTLKVPAQTSRPSRGGSMGLKITNKSFRIPFWSVGPTDHTVYHPRLTATQSRTVTQHGGTPCKTTRQKSSWPNCLVIRASQQAQHPGPIVRKPLTKAPRLRLRQLTLSRALLATPDLRCSRALPPLLPLLRRTSCTARSCLMAYSPSGTRPGRSRRWRREPVRTRTRLLRANPTDCKRTLISLQTPSAARS